MRILFGERLQQLRKERNLTQAQLAEFLETTQRRISYLESYKIEPDLLMLWKVANYFGVSVEYLIGMTDY